MINPFILKYAPAPSVQLADKLLELRKTKNKWEVIAFVISSWIKTKPRHWDSHLVSLRDIKETRKTTTVGSKQFSGVSKDKVTGGYLRYTLDIPEKVILIIRRLYTAEELPMDKKFFADFARRFPIFVVSRRV